MCVKTKKCSSNTSPSPTSKWSPECSKFLILSTRTKWSPRDRSLCLSLSLISSILAHSWETALAWAVGKLLVCLYYLFIYLFIMNKKNTHNFHCRDLDQSNLLWIMDKKNTTWAGPISLHRQKRGKWMGKFPREGPRGHTMR